MPTRQSWWQHWWHSAMPKLTKRLEIERLPFIWLWRYSVGIVKLCSKFSLLFYSQILNPIFISQWHVHNSTNLSVVVLRHDKVIFQNSFLVRTTWVNKMELSNYPAPSCSLTLHARVQASILESFTQQEIIPCTPYNILALLFPNEAYIIILKIMPV